MTEDLKKRVIKTTSVNPIDWFGRQRRSCSGSETTYAEERISPLRNNFDFLFFDTVNEFWSTNTYVSPSIFSSINFNSRERDLED